MSDKADLLLRIVGGLVLIVAALRMWYFELWCAQLKDKNDELQLEVRIAKLMFKDVTLTWEMAEAQLRNEPEKPNRYTMSASRYSQACRAWNKVHPVSPPPPPPPKKSQGKTQ